MESLYKQIVSKILNLLEILAFTWGSSTEHEELTDCTIKTIWSVNKYGLTF
jgi:hypothetical protein